MAKKLRAVVNARATADLTSGRVQQKTRTRAALVDAAISLIRKGETFTVADVADLALVSRTTAYNYFPTAESLYAQAALTFVATDDYPDFSAQFARTGDVDVRVREVVEASDASVALHEPLYRAVLKVLLDGNADAKLPRRSPHRLRYLADAIEPLRAKLDRRTYARVLGALSLCAGIEAHVSLLDVCGMSKKEARETKIWAAHAIVTTALAELA